MTLYETVYDVWQAYVKGNVAAAATNRTGTRRGPCDTFGQLYARCALPQLQQSLQRQARGRDRQRSEALVTVFEIVRVLSDELKKPYSDIWQAAAPIAPPVGVASSASGAAVVGTGTEGAVVGGGPLGGSVASVPGVSVSGSPGGGVGAASASGKAPARRRSSNSKSKVVRQGGKRVAPGRAKKGERGKNVGRQEARGKGNKMTVTDQSKLYSRGEASCFRESEKATGRFASLTHQLVLSPSLVRTALPPVASTRICFLWSSRRPAKKPKRRRLLRPPPSRHRPAHCSLLRPRPVSTKIAVITGINEIKEVAKIALSRSEQKQNKMAVIKPR